jgi:hypothetical protein
LPDNQNYLSNLFLHSKINRTLKKGALISASLGESMSDETPQKELTREELYEKVWSTKIPSPVVQQSGYGYSSTPAPAPAPYPFWLKYQGR